MSRTVTCASAEAASVSGSAFAGNDGASELPSSVLSAPEVPAADDAAGAEDDEPDAAAGSASPPEPHPVSRAAASRRAADDGARLMGTAWQAVTGRPRPDARPRPSHP